MRLSATILLLPIVLAACGSHDKVTASATAESKTVSGLDIDTDKFKANFEIPGLSFGGEQMDIAGMKLYPGSIVRGVRVKASQKNGDEKGMVTIDFTSPAAPAAVATQFGEQARKAGFVVAPTAGNGLGGEKRDDDGTDRFALALLGDGAATKGQLTLTHAKATSHW